MDDEPKPWTAEWTPATSHPGEMDTIEGRIQSVGVAARNLKNRDPRARAYRRQMMRQGWWILGAIVAVVAAVIAVAAIAAAIR